MALSSFEQVSGGDVYNQDPRRINGLATGQGKVLQFGPISTASSGATQLVAAPASGLIYVVSYVVVASAAVTVTFQSATNALTGPMSLAANGGVVAMGAPSSHLFQCAAAAALNINLGSAVQVSGHFSYFIE